MIRACRMPTVCAACRRCTARSAARWPIARKFSRSNPARRPTIRSSSPTTGDVLSGGNFHGAPLALALDYAAIALTDLMSISERRIDRLVNPDTSEGLPAFLAETRGMQSGFMIPHVAAVALLNEAKVLAHPASVDNLPTSGGKEDHVSMGMTAALKLRTIVENAENLLAIELLAAATALEYRRPLKAGVGVEQRLRTGAHDGSAARRRSRDVCAISSASPARFAPESSIAKWKSYERKASDSRAARQRN